MSLRNLRLLKGLIALLLVWGIAWGLGRIAKSQLPTVEKVHEFVQENPLSEISDPAERKKLISNLASMLNRMDPGELRNFEQGDREAQERVGQAFFREMTPDEQRYFLEMRVGKAFKQMMQSFNQMDREERRRIVERSMKEMKEGQGITARLEETDPEIVEKITNAGLEAYYESASMESKMDLAPLMEEMQRSMSTQMRRRKR